MTEMRVDEVGSWRKILWKDPLKTVARRVPCFCSGPFYLLQRDPLLYWRGALPPTEGSPFASRHSPLASPGILLYRLTKIWEFMHHTQTILNGAHMIQSDFQISSCILRSRAQSKNIRSFITVHVHLARWCPQFLWRAIPTPQLPTHRLNFSNDKPFHCWLCTAMSFGVFKDGFISAPFRTAIA